MFPLSVGQSPMYWTSRTPTSTRTFQSHHCHTSIVLSQITEWIEQIMGGHPALSIKNKTPTNWITISSMSLYRLWVRHRASKNGTLKPHMDHLVKASPEHQPRYPKLRNQTTLNIQCIKHWVHKGFWLTVLTKTETGCRCIQKLTKWEASSFHLLFRLSTKCLWQTKK